jgi:peptide/nickel transport system substrate-binding protein
MHRILSRVTTASGIAALLIGVSLGAALHPAAARTGAAPVAANARTLIVARTLDDIKTMDPDRMYEFSSEAAGANIFEPLIRFQGQNVSKPLPNLATKWKITRGGRVYTFQLRHDVTFSTGRHMTAADVVFSYRRMGYLNDEPAFLMGASPIGKRIVIYGIKALGKYTVQFTLPAPDYSFLAQLVDLNFGVLDSVAARQHGAVDTPNAATKDKATPWLNEHSISTGAFMLSSWVRGAAGSVTLVRNPHYWGKKPFLNKIIFRGVESAATQRLEVQRGTIDVAQSIDADGVKALRNDPSVKIVHGNSLDLVYMGMTLNPTISKPLSIPLVRQAIRHAIDYNGIINGLLGGLATQTNGMIPVGLTGNQPATNSKLKPSYDPALARSLLKQAGYPNGFDVDLYYGAGHVVDGVSMDLVMPLIQQNLKAVGINVTLKPEDFTVMLAAYRAQKLPMVAIEWGVDYPDPGDFAGPFSPGGGPAKRMWWTGGDAHLTSLIAKGLATGNKLNRAGIYRQIENIWLKESAFAPIVQPQNLVVLHKGVSGYVFSPLYVQGDFRYVRKS